MRDNTFKGIPASDGIAIGPAFRYAPVDLVIPYRLPDPVDEEMARFYKAQEQAHGDLQCLYKSVHDRVGTEQASIFEAHQQILFDPTLKEKVLEYIYKGQTIEQALLNAAEELSNLLGGMKNELFAARALDVKDVSRRLLRILLELPNTTLDDLSVPSIIIAEELTPSDTICLNPLLTLGFITIKGGITSHTAILARSLGLPAIVGVNPLLLEKISAGTNIAMDGHSGEVIVEPDRETVALYETLKGQYEMYSIKLKFAAVNKACSASGRRVEVAANIGDVSSAREAIEYGAEGIGLLRTEFLYLNDIQPPNEERQYQIYREIFEIMSGCPVIVRTLDIGGDKPPTYLPFPEEMNPYLGWRAIRICLDEPELFKTQLRAILRAAIGHNVRIMFPMISDLYELRRARDFIEMVKNELDLSSVEYSHNIPIGIMVETPAAAVLVDVLAEEVDFFSIGTNDLTQYTLAVDRGNMKVSSLYQPLHPAVLRLIKQTIDVAHERGKWVGLCGELASMPKAIPILLGFGLDEFSMNPRSIPEAKNIIGKISDEKARDIAVEVLSFSTASDIEHYMDDILLSL